MLGVEYLSTLVLACKSAIQFWCGSRNCREWPSRTLLESAGSFRVERRGGVVKTKPLFVPCAVDAAASSPPVPSCNFVPWRFEPGARLARPRSVAEPGPTSLGFDVRGKLGQSPASSLELSGSSSVAGDREVSITILAEYNASTFTAPHSSFYPQPILARRPMSNRPKGLRPAGLLSL